MNSGDDIKFIATIESCEAIDGKIVVKMRDESGALVRLDLTPEDSKRLREELEVVEGDGS